MLCIEWFLRSETGGVGHNVAVPLVLAGVFFSVIVGMARDHNQMPGGQNANMTVWIDIPEWLGGSGSRLPQIGPLTDRR